MQLNKIHFAASACLLLAASTVCNDGSGNDWSMKPRREVRSSEDFSKGLSAGRADAHDGWSDHSAAWTWYWMMPEDYRMGYDQGWKNGRAEKRARDFSEEQARKQRRSMELQREEAGEDAGS